MYSKCFSTPALKGKIMQCQKGCKYAEKAKLPVVGFWASKASPMDFPNQEIIKDFTSQLDRMGASVFILAHNTKYKQVMSL